jgi:hypothetical protein
MRRCILHTLATALPLILEQPRYLWECDEALMKTYVGPWQDAAFGT